MKLFVVLAVCVAGACAASYGGYSAPAVRVSSGYETPVVTVPEIRSSGYGYAAPAPVLKSVHVPIVRFNLDDDNYGTFKFDHLSGDGTTVTEEGHLKNLGDEEGPVSVMSGQYSFVGDDGKTYVTSWTSDENGFRAVGDHLPTPVPMPAELVRAYAEAASFESAPLIRSSGYESAPLIRSSGYSAPVVVKSSGYSAPVVVSPIVRSGYSAPALTQTFEAPAIRVVSSSRY